MQFDAISTNPSTGRPPKHIIVLLHGYGQSGDYMIRKLVNPLQVDFPDSLFVAPNAPHPCKQYGEGFDWLRFDGIWIEETIIQTAHETTLQLHKYINELSNAYSIKSTNILVIGFSQGGRLAVQLGVTYRDELAGIVSIGGGVYAPAFPSVLAQKPKTLLIHGKADDVVPETYYDESMMLLQSRGITVSGEVIPDLGHKINGQVAELCKVFMKSILL